MAAATSSQFSCSLLAPSEDELWRSTSTSGSSGGGAGPGGTGGATSNGGRASGGAEASAGGPDGRDPGNGGSAGTACAADQKDCGGCVAVDDPAYGCGANGCTPCAIPHADATCTGGACELGACREPWVDANSSPRDGCESLTRIPSQGLALWLSAGDGVVLEAGELSVWQDQSGNGMDATPGTAAQAPKLVQDPTTGSPALEFDGSDDQLRLPSGFSTFDGLTFFVVAEATTDLGCSRFLDLGAASANDRLSFGRDGAAPFYRRGASTFVGSSNRLLSGAPFLFSVYHYTNTTVSFSANTAYAGGGMASPPASIAHVDNFLGVSADAECTPFQGRVFEILLYSRIGATADRAAVETYLQDKWRCCTPN